MRLGLRVLTIAMLALVVDPTRASADPARLVGQLSLGIPGANLESIGPVVVYLDPVDPAPPFGVPTTKAELRQENARFAPAFQVIVKGQTVEMPNFDAIYHNVFSYSRPNDFDLGTYPAGESRSITFHHAGIVKTYCSIHERMSATLFVSPSPWVTVATRSGHYVIADVPPGRYVLRTWTERLPATAAPIAFTSGERLALDIELGSDAR